MTEEDVEALLAWPEINLCTDGELAGSHPRGYGSFTRVLGRYVRERGVLSLEEAVHRMSALAAQHMGIEDRGVVRPGAWADLVLFDPDKVIDRATTDEPHAVSEGIVAVWVNGGLAWADGRVTQRRGGTVIRRGS
jgi:N-acyl-D-amino-acid deacylase